MVDEFILLLIRVQYSFWFQWFSLIGAQTSKCPLHPAVCLIKFHSDSTVVLPQDTHKFNPWIINPIFMINELVVLFIIFQSSHGLHFRCKISWNRFNQLDLIETALGFDHEDNSCIIDRCDTWIDGSLWNSFETNLKQSEYTHNQLSRKSVKSKWM